MLAGDSQGPIATAADPQAGPRAMPDEERDPIEGGDGEIAKRLGGLVLTRRVGQSIMIGGEIELEVVGLKPGAVRLRIVAPREVAVHRREVYDAIRSDPRPVVPKAVPVPRPNSTRGVPGGLVLTRHPDQAIMIGDSIAIDVVDIRTSAVRLRIVAPREVAVHRREVFDAIRRGEAGPDS